MKPKRNDTKYCSRSLREKDTPHKLKSCAFYIWKVIHRIFWGIDDNNRKWNSDQKKKHISWEWLKRWTLIIMLIFDTCKKEEEKKCHRLKQHTHKHQNKVCEMISWMTRNDFDIENQYLLYDHSIFSSMFFFFCFVANERCQFILNEHIIETHLHSHLRSLFISVQFSMYRHEKNNLPTKNDEKCVSLTFIQWTLFHPYSDCINVQKQKNCQWCNAHNWIEKCFRWFFVQRSS